MYYDLFHFGLNTSGTGTAYPSGAPEFTPGFKWGSCYAIFNFMCMFSWFCRSLFVLWYFFFWPLCCLFFFDLQILITPLVSSNSFCGKRTPAQTFCVSHHFQFFVFYFDGTRRTLTLVRRGCSNLC